jgi:hypothetical protein
MNALLGGRQRVWEKDGRMDGEDGDEKRREGI